MIEFKGMTWDHPRGVDPLVAASEEYNRLNPQVKIEREKRSLQAFADQPLETMASTYDFMVIDHPHVGEASAQGVLIALDGKGYEHELAALAANSTGASHRSYEWEGHQWALAIDSAAQVAARRRDLLESPITTWDEVIRLAETGKVLFPLKPVDAVDAFLSLCANIDDPCAETSTTLVSRKTGVYVLEQMYAVAKHLDQRCFAMNPIGALDLMSETDDFVYCPMLFGYVNYSQAGFRSKLVHHENMPVLGNDGPKGSILGGTGICVSSLTKHQEEAIKFAFWLAGEECQTGVYAANNGQPGHAKAWVSVQNNARSNNFFSNTKETLDRSWLRPRYAGFLNFADEGGDAVNAFVRGDATAEATMDILERSYLNSLGQSAS
ncbi:extracellular solute-binding protein [Rhodobacteraceae bacterium RKSG542]|uniref:extracellular solute-binding protein n=1 Tax=Pseudovibrio flavus TaxID=2529854 RepID=UPI0012BC0645|nr:extracellular solute-binding protein [Pseudovibrio flavus]MTI15930.1 extracellular solute-binding protein [Pseudovibrio flavus]